MSKNENLCMVCSVEQKCCKDMGLKLSKREFETHFKDYSGRFLVVRHGKMVVVFPQEGQPCPYLTEQGCQIYQDRPIDCRLYPYELNRLVEKKDRIEAVIYDQTDCPHKEDLFMPIEEAKDLIRELAGEVYGPDKSVEIRYQPGQKRRRQFGPLSPLVAKISNLLNAHKG